MTQPLFPPSQAPQLYPKPDPSDLKDCTLAAIDIGTNSIHMVIVKIQPRLPSFTIIAREKDTVRLGNRDPETGNLTQEATERAIAALKRCQDLAASFGAQHLVAVATSAVREAPNGQGFIQEVEERLGLEVNLISGPEEARRIYLGVLSSYDFGDRSHVIIDIGGGSTELILADRKEARFLSSTKVGAVRLTQDFVHSDPISKSEFRQLRAYINGMMERTTDELRQTLKPGEVPRLIGTSGTIETLATLHAFKHVGSVPNPLQGYGFSRDELEKMVNHLASLTEAQRNELEGMSEKRAEIIVAGALILLETMKILGLEEIKICEMALREGVIVDWMLTHGLIEDRLRFQISIRERSVLAIAHKYQVDLGSSQRVARFALSIFDQLQGPLHHWGGEEREILWGAAILHKCGLHVSHAAYHKHSYYLIRHGELLGFTETELELIANVARYHRKSKPKKRKHLSYGGLSKINRLKVRQLSGILRLAVALDRRQIPAVDQIQCYYHGPSAQLDLTIFPSDSGDRCGLERWSLEYKKAVFAEEFGITVNVHLA